MKRCVYTYALMLGILAILPPLSAQDLPEQELSEKLSEKLRAESTAALAMDAREHGSAVRGAILFTRPNLNCTRCHAPGDARSLGPDLTQPGTEKTDLHLVESLLEPSKVIRKGFESVTIVTQDGRTIAGRIVDEDTESLVVRDTSDELKLITLARADIEEIATNTVSAMPDNLVDQLQNRAEFLDLVRYVMQLAETGEGGGAQLARPGGKSVSPVVQGIALIKGFNCAACHRDDLTQTSLPDKIAPLLSRLGERANPEYVQRFVADPLHVKPGTTMPDVMHQLPSQERETAAAEITHYLVSLSENTFAVQTLETEAAPRGQQLFHTVGCVACHSPRDDSGTELLADTSVPLGSVDQKYNRDGLVAFLENPLQVRPSGRMPRMNLTHWEAVDLASYLLSGRPKSGDPAAKPLVPDRDLATRGKARFDALGCSQCHRTESPQPPPASVALSKVNPVEGCLADAPGSWPRFAMTADQRRSLQAALSSSPAPLPPREDLALNLHAFRCLNCHQRGELGGVSIDRDPYFHTENPNLGPQGRIPPTLTGVGAKLKPRWMRQVLVSGRAIRPYVLTRMPQYGTDNVAQLVGRFGEVDELPEMQFAEFEDQKLMRETGAEMVGTGGLNCIACHTFQLKQAANMPAVDLTEMAERLQKNWFYHYMRNPQQLSQNTIMPSFWPRGRAMRQDILDGDTDLQIEALWQYLLDGRQARTPRGLIRERLELLATDEAVMLRRKYPQIGKRGIGVGYPHQVNLAFDAEQMRLATIWKGQFADPGGVWTSQGHGQVRPLGSSVIHFAPGPDLDDPDAPWIVDDGRPPHHQFKGYTLDEKMRPRFRYEFAGIRVEDYCVDALDSTGRPFLHRTVTLRGGSEDHRVAFRAATGKTIVQEEDGVFLVDDTLRIRIAGEHSGVTGVTGVIVEGPDADALRIPVKLDRETTVLTLDYQW